MDDALDAGAGPPKSKIIIAPSILSADAGRLREEIAAMEAAGADWIHVDVMDGHFVPNLAFAPNVVKMAKSACGLVMDVHLMVSDPLKFGPVFAGAGADRVSFHAEATVHHERVCRDIRAAGAAPGLALNPSTDPEALRWFLPELEQVTLMGVNPGFGGQSLLPSVYGKIRAVVELMEDLGRRVPIEIDGGVDDLTAKGLAVAGADVLVSGSHLFGQKDYAEAVRRLRRRAEPGPP